MTPGLLGRLRLVSRRVPARRSPAAHSRRRAARAALGSGLIAVLAATAGMTAALETARPQWRDPEFGHRLMRLRAAAPDRPLVVVIGTSRTQNAIWPAAMGLPDGPGLPRVFNLGLSGLTPLGQLVTLHRLLDAGIRPAAVVVEFLPIWLVVDGPAEDQLGGHVARLTAADLRHLAPYCRDPGELWAKWLAARVAPWHAQRLSLVSHWMPRWLPWSMRLDGQWDAMDADGFAPIPYDDPDPEMRTRMTARAREEYAAAFGRFRPGAASDRAVRDLVALCRAEGVAVAFLEPPVSAVFRGWFDPPVWAAADDHLHALAREAGVPVFGPPELPERDFADGHHLLRGGAAAYSRWLAETHLKPWLTNPGGRR